MNISYPIPTHIERTLYIFGVRVDNTKSDAALERIRSFIGEETPHRAKEIFFTNVHSIHLALHDPKFHRYLNHADMVLPDGSGLNLAGRLFRAPILENLNGTDFTPKLLSHAESKGWTVYLLGAHPAVIEQCHTQLRRQFPSLNITGFHHGHFSPKEDGAIVDDINAKRPNILLVALGSPLQEEWIVQHAARLRVGVCLAVGGLFDFLSGLRKRAPRWMRRMGIEWLYRFFQDPKNKWERIFIEMPEFILMLIIGKMIPRRMKPVRLAGNFQRER